MSNRYRDSMDRLHFTQEQKQEMVDRLMEAGPVSSVRRPLRFRRIAAVGVAAAFCGVTNCPLSSLLLAVELFGGGGLPLFALAVAVSYRLSGYTGLYSEQQIVYAKHIPQQIEKKAE